MSYYVLSGGKTRKERLFYILIIIMNSYSRYERASAWIGFNINETQT